MKIDGKSKLILYGLGIFGITAWTVNFVVRSQRKKLYSQLEIELKAGGTTKTVDSTQATSGAFYKQYVPKAGQKALFQLWDAKMVNASANKFKKLLIDDPTFYTGYNIDEDAVFVELRAIPSKAVMSQVTEQFNKLTKLDFSTELKRIGSSDVAMANEIISKLPVVIKN